MIPAGRTATLLALHIGALYPLALALWDFHSGGFSANPIEDITRRSGHAALVLLSLSLSATPLRLVTGWPGFIRYRRPLGLYSFLYASIHLSIFVGLDYGFDWEFILLEFPKKRFVAAGLGAYAVLFAMAATSFPVMVRQLGPAWKKLHSLVYPASLLAAAHFVWLTKGDKARPLIYTSVILALLAARLIPRWKDSFWRS